MLNLVNSQLVEYIKDQKKKGYSIDDISKAILDAGYSKKQLKEAINSSQKTVIQKDKNLTPYYIGIIAILFAISLTVIAIQINSDSKDEVRNYDYYREKFSNTNNLWLKYNTKGDIEAKIDIVKKGNLEYTKSELLINNFPFISEIFKKNNYSIICINDNCKKGYESLIPDLKTLKREMVYTGRENHLGRPCISYKVNSRYQPNDPYLNAINGTTYEYDICVDTQSGFLHYINATITNQTSRVMDYVIQLENFNSNPPTIKEPGFLLINVSCQTDNIGIEILPLKDNEMIAKLYRNNLELNQFNILPSELETKEKNSFNFETTNQLTSSEYYIEVCQQNYCSQKSCVVS